MERAERDPKLFLLCNVGFYPLQEKCNQSEFLRRKQGGKGSYFRALFHAAQDTVSCSHALDKIILGCAKAFLVYHLRGVAF